MFCLKCGKQIPEESIYCLYCGIKLPELETEKRSVWDIRPRTVRIHTPSSTVLPPRTSDIMKTSARIVTASEEVKQDDSLTLTLDAIAELPMQTLQKCNVCGRPLPETSISELCVTCLNNRSFVPTELPDELFDTLFSQEQDLDTQNADTLASSGIAHTDAMPTSKSDFRLDIDLDSEYPTAYAEPAPKTKREIKNPKKLALIIFVLSAALLLGGAAIALPYLLPASSDQTSSTSQSNVERKAISYAHEMLKESCANPDSVSFYKDVNAEETDGVWSISETFDRTSKQGEFATTTYTALLRLDSEKSAGYVPLKLRIDDTIMYDHTATS